MQACLHPFFDDLRDPESKMTDGSPLANALFTFTTEELQLALEVADRLIPEHLASTISLPPLTMDATLSSSTHTPTGLA